MAHKPAPKKPQFPIIVETFNPARYQFNSHTQNEPTCFNGMVRIRKYRVTVEEVQEPIEVLQERVRELWRTCDNHHHWAPLQAAAKEVGIELDHAEYGRK